MAGQLYVVATPIGNLGDITQRAIEVLGLVDIIACEDTRRTEKLMRYLGLKKPLVRYDENVHKKVFPTLLNQIQAGKSMALVSDAGTPGVSDPGSRLVDEAKKVGIEVLPIPGPSAVVAALCVAGFKDQGFVFLGFLPRRKGRAKRELQQALGLSKMVVVLESPFRVGATLGVVEEISPTSQICVAREMTKIHEEYQRGDIRTIRSKLGNKELKGEFVLIIEPPEK